MWVFRNKLEPNLYLSRDWPRGQSGFTAAPGQDRLRVGPHPERAQFSTAADAAAWYHGLFGREVFASPTWELVRVDPADLTGGRAATAA